MNWRSWSVAGLLFAHCAAAVAAIEVGWIESAQGKLEDASIQRGKASLPVVRFQTLLEGDVLLVKKGAQIEVRLGEGEKSITVTAAESPYRVARVGEVSGAWSRMLGWLRNIALNSVGKGEQGSERLQVAATRAIDAKRPFLSMPMLENSEYALVAGQRDIHFAWLGGQSPYSIRLSDRQTGSTLMEAGGLQSARARLPGVNLPPGSYLVRIADAAGVSRVLRLEAVTESELPAPPDAANGPALTPDARTFYYAAWLMGQQNGKWVLEAYQQLTRLNLPEAAFLRDALAQGQGLSVPLP